MTLDDLRRTHRDRILTIARNHGVTSVKIFGSIARGDSDPGSDIDLLIEAGTHTSRFFPGGLVADLEELTGQRVDVVEEPALRTSMRERILAEAIPL